MALLWSRKQDAPVFGVRAGGEASLGAIFDASLAQARYVDNLNAAQAAMEEAYRRHNNAVFALTGEKLPNPMFGASGDPVAMATLSHYDGRRADYMRRLDDLAGRHPDTAQFILPQTSFEDQALTLTRQTEDRFTRLAGSRDGAGKWISMLAGGIAGAARDPLQVATWVAGGGPGAARTVAGRILTVAATEAAVNAGVELAMQPIVQSYRRRAGLEYGLVEGAQNVAMAGLMAGALGAAGRGIFEGLTLGGRSAAQAARANLPNVPKGDPARAAMEADIAAALPAIRDAMPAPARGAVDAMAMNAHLDITRPAAALPETHDVNLSRAHRMLDADPLEIEERGLRFERDAAQVERIVEALMPAAARGPQPQPRSLVGFLIDHGGLKDFQGELAALGADRVSERFRGRLVRGDGMALDHAREIAEEAGYIGRAGEAQATSVADLLSAIDSELRGQPVLSRADAELAAGNRAADHARAAVEDAVSEVASFAGPGVEDRIIREAAEAMLTDGLDAGDALERVLVRMDDAGETAGTRSGAPLPGWSDAELEAAAAARGLPPEASPGGIDDPAPSRLGDGEEYTVTPAELEEFGGIEIVGDDGQAVALARFMEEAQRLDDEAALIAACRGL